MMSSVVKGGYHYMDNYNSYLNANQSVLPTANLPSIESLPGVQSSGKIGSVTLFSTPGAMTTMESSLLNVQQSEIVAAVKNAAAFLLKSSENESIEYLDIDSYHRDTRLITGDDRGEKIRGRLFMNARVVKVNGYMDDNKEIGAIIKLQLSGSDKEIEVIIEPCLWGSTKLVDTIEGFGIRIVAKISKERKRDLLSGYIKSLMKEDLIITPMHNTKWAIKENRLFYVDGERYEAVDSENVRKRIIQKHNHETALSNMETLKKSLKIFKEPEYAALILLSCVGGFMKSILLRSGWTPEAALCLCGDKVEIFSVIECFTSYWENMEPRIISAAQPEKRFKEEIINTGDELILIDCGHEIVSSSYKENQRKANIQFATEWGNRDCRCFPVLMSNDVFDVYNLSENIIPIVIEEKDIQWDEWQKYGNQKNSICSFIRLIRDYIESAGESVQKRIAEVIAIEYAAAHGKSVYPGLKAVYLAIQDTISRMAEYWNLPEQLTAVLTLTNGRAVELLELYSDIPAKEFISEQFVACMDVLVERGDIRFIDISLCSDIAKTNAGIFYDHKFLYMDMEVFKTLVLKEMAISSKNASKVLGMLKEEEYVNPYRNGKDFCVDVSLGKCLKRKSMLRFWRDKFKNTFKPDIVMRGGM